MIALFCLTLTFALGVAVGSLWQRRSQECHRRALQAEIDRLKGKSDTMTKAIKDNQ